MRRRQHGRYSAAEVGAALGGVTASAVNSALHRRGRSLTDFAGVVELLRSRWMAEVRPALQAVQKENAALLKVLGDAAYDETTRTFTITVSYPELRRLLGAVRAQHVRAEARRRQR